MVGRNFSPPILELILEGIESDVHWGVTDLHFDPYLAPKWLRLFLLVSLYCKAPLKQNAEKRFCGRKRPGTLISL